MTFCIAVRIGSVAPCRGRYSRYFAINLNHPEVGDLQTLRAVQNEGLVQPPKRSVPVQAPALPGRSLRSPIGHQSLTDVLPCGYFCSGFLQLPAMAVSCRRADQCDQSRLYIPYHTSQIGRCYIPWSRGLIMYLSSLCV